MTAENEIDGVILHPFLSATFARGLREMRARNLGQRIGVIDFNRSAVAYFSQRNLAICVRPEDEKVNGLPGDIVELAKIHYRQAVWLPTMTVEHEWSTVLADVKPRLKGGRIVWPRWRS